MLKLHDSFDSIQAAKKVSLEHKMNALQELILQRYQALTTISSISFAVSGIVLSTGNYLIKNEVLAVISVLLFVLIALVGFGRYLYLIRNDIKGITQKIIDLPNEDWTKPLEEKTFKADWWPETLYFLLIVGVILFGVSFM